MPAVHHHRAAEKRGRAQTHGAEKPPPRCGDRQHPPGQGNAVHGGSACRQGAGGSAESDRAHEAVERVERGRHRLHHQGGTGHGKGDSAQGVGSRRAVVSACQICLGGAGQLRLRRERDHLSDPEPDRNQPHALGECVGAHAQRHADHGSQPQYRAAAGHQRPRVDHQRGRRSGTDRAGGVLCEAAGVCRTARKQHHEPDEQHAVHLGRERCRARRYAPG